MYRASPLEEPFPLGWRVSVCTGGGEDRKILDLVLLNLVFILRNGCHKRLKRVFLVSLLNLEFSLSMSITIMMKLINPHYICPVLVTFLILS